MRNLRHPVLHGLALFVLPCLLSASAATVAAQSAPAAQPSSPQAPQAPSAPAPAGAAAPSPGVYPPPADAALPASADPSPSAQPSAPPLAASPQPTPPARDPANVQQLTRELVALEQSAQQLELERAAVPTIGVRIGKSVSWTVAGVLLFTALGQVGAAEQIKEAREDGRTDKAYDRDDDGDVDRHDELKARKVARALALTSIVPLGLGVFSTVLYRQRLRKIRGLSQQLDQVSDRRRSLIQRLGYEVGVSPGQAALGLRLAF